MLNMIKKIKSMRNYQGGICFSCCFISCIIWYSHYRESTFNINNSAQLGTLSMKQEEGNKDNIPNLTKPVMTFLSIAGLLIMASVLQSTTLIFTQLLHIRR